MQFYLICDISVVKKHHLKKKIGKKKPHVEKKNHMWKKKSTCQSSRLKVHSFRWGKGGYSHDGNLFFRGEKPHVEKKHMWKKKAHVKIHFFWM